MVRKRAGSDDLWRVQDAAEGEAASGKSLNLDLQRAVKTSLFGLGFVGPVGHYWYLFLFTLSWPVVAFYGARQLCPRNVSFLDIILSLPVH